MTNAELSKIVQELSAKVDALGKTTDPSATSDTLAQDPSPYYAATEAIASGYFPDIFKSTILAARIKTPDAE